MDKFKEQGSEFHLMDYQIEVAPVYPWRDNCLYMGSGRDAIRCLLNYGIQHRGWLRLWIPGYFCLEVVDSIRSSSITVMVYNNNPFKKQDEWDRLPLKAGDVILVVNYYGLGCQPDFTNIDRESVEIIEDHSHDPCSDWAWSSTADWCIASLRKTLPIPDGGVLWSPRGLPLPEPVEITIDHKIASLEKLAAMVLKRYYLEDLPVQKQVFRELAINGESNIASGDISAMSLWTREMLNTFSIDRWRKMRIRNYYRMVDILKACDFIGIPPAVPAGACPFSVPLLFDTSARRDYVRQRLIDHAVYPTILWELDNSLAGSISAVAINISRRILCIHCDMRYGDPTMDYVANLVVFLAREFSSTR